MNVTMEWGSKNIVVPRTEMLLVQTVPSEIRQLDLDEFRFAMHDKQDDDYGMAYKHMHERVPPKTVAGVVLAQVIEIVNDYTITFEDGTYNVNIVGGNSNVSDVTIKNIVGVNTSNSAGLQDLSSLQAASFGGVVTIDLINGVSGTVFPIGTKGTPSNNIADTKTILAKQNMNTIEVIGSLTLVSGDDVSDLIMRGTNPLTSSLTVEAAAVTDNLYVRDLYFTGSLDGGTVLRDCVVGDVDYFDGYIEHCALTSSTIIVNGTAVLLDCRAGATCVSPPILDLTNVVGLSIREYNGNLIIKEKHNTSTCQVGMNGILHIDSTADNGSIIVYGDAHVSDNSTGAFVLDDRTTGSPADIAAAMLASNVDGHTVEGLLEKISYIQGNVWIDTTAIINGDGSQGSPFNNMDDAKNFCESSGIKNVFLSGEIIVPGNMKNVNVYGVGLPKIDLNGMEMKHTKFYQCSLSGAYTSSIIAQQCRLENNMLLSGHFDECEALGNLIANTDSAILMNNCMSGIPGLGRPTLSMGTGLPTKIGIRSWRGGLTVSNCNNVSDEITVEVAQGSITFDNTCTAGTMVARGVCTFVDETVGATVVDETVNDEVNVIEVTGTPVVDIEDFKADVSGLEAGVNLTSVGGTPVSGPSDLQNDIPTLITAILDDVAP